MQPPTIDAFKPVHPLLINNGDSVGKLLPSIGKVSAISDPWGTILACSFTVGRQGVGKAHVQSDLFAGLSQGAPLTVSLAPPPGHSGH